MVLLLLALACAGDEPAPAPAATPAPEVAPAPAATPAPEAPPAGMSAPLATRLAEIPEDARSASAPTLDDEGLALGASVYSSRCEKCHGEALDGQGPAATALPQRPTDFTDAERWAATTLGEKQWLLLHGVPGTPMAPMKGDAAETEAWAVLAWLDTQRQPE